MLPPFVADMNIAVPVVQFLRAQGKVLMWYPRAKKVGTGMKTETS